jgi:anti-sigma regulatory factor (Ser/Thr protein kinase)
VSSAPFVLDVPSEPQNLGTARTFATRVASHFGCDDDTVLDLRLAVSEACTESMASPEPSESTIRVSLEPGADRLRVEITGTGSFAGDDGYRLSAGEPTRLELIRTLFPDAIVAPVKDGLHALRFSVPTRD